MVLSKKYSNIIICPNTKEELSEGDIYYNRGICSSCGHRKDSTVSHFDVVVGKWMCYSFLERLFGKKEYFIPSKELGNKL